MGDSPEDAWTSVWCLRPYHSYRIYGVELNPEFVKATDGRLLDFKEGKGWAVAAEIKEMQTALKSLEMSEPILVALVPGHEAKTTNAGCPLARVALALAASDKRLTADIDLIIRHTTIPKLATGGNRGIQVHLDSMRVTRRVPGATVIVLDDVVTTGNSMAASRQLLGEKAAKHVAGISLCQTV
jgi:predicted amidophosphoribosyltransferase